MPESVAVRLTISGRVQGVGFRPTVFRLATAAGLAGTVRNTAGSVVIELEGRPRDIDRFQADLQTNLPTLARIAGLTREDIPVTGRSGFEILDSVSGPESQEPCIPYDVATCPDCLSEVRDPKDRRHGYPFSNCTLCGPRYTITESVPYDRPNTTMRGFPMCADCLREYENPADRRYHAQPIACPQCGPRLSLVNALGSRIPGDPLDAARRLLRQEQIVAVRGLGGFHLAVDASNPEAVRRLKRRKRRERKPLALLSPDLAAVEGYARLEPGEASLLGSDRAPIVLVERLRPFPLPEEIAPGSPRIGVMLAYTPLHHLLAEGFSALVMTSGNHSEEPIVCDNQQALKKLCNLADAFLVHDREIVTSCDDSVVFHRRGRTGFVRRSRGYVPDPVPLPGAAGGILAVGAQLKNTFCLTRDDQAVLSQHIGDLETLEAYDHFLASLSRLKDFLRIDPCVVACDLHPDYLSTRYAEQQAAIRIERVQHHHAHLAACMADNQLSGTVIGLCLDGTGLGDDGTIWGGEVLVGDFRVYRRAARLTPFPLPGGERAIREPWRTAVGLLLSRLGKAAVEQLLPAATGVDPQTLEKVVSATSRQFNSPLTSSLGRFFDAVSALLSICTSVHYDGQAAVELECMAGDEPGTAWPMAFKESSGLLELDPGPLLEKLTDEMKRRTPTSALAASFHESVAAGFTQACIRIRQAGGPGRVVMSGGCLLNRRLDLALESRLVQAGFEVYTHRQVPANDGGLCLGQAAVAAARTRA